MAMTHPLPYSYFKKMIVSHGEARISIASHSLQYGTSSFTGIRGYFRNGEMKVFRLKDHFIRLVNNCKILRIPLDLKWEDFQTIVVDLVKANKPNRDIYIRPFIYSAEEVLVPRFDNLEYELAVYMLEMGEYHALNRGIKLMTSSWHKFSHNAFPAKAKAGGAYVNSAMATTEAKSLGFDDALMLDDLGNVVEATTSNLMIVYRGEIIMPPIGTSQLEGVTRRTVIYFLEEEGIKIRYEPIDRPMIYVADEVLLTGTAAQVVFAHSVDGRVINNEDKPGKIATLLRSKFTDLIEGRHKMSQEWFTNVKLFYSE